MKGYTCIKVEEGIHFEGPKTSPNLEFLERQNYLIPFKIRLWELKFYLYALVRKSIF